MLRNRFATNGCGCNLNVTYQSPNEFEQIQTHTRREWFFHCVNGELTANKTIAKCALAMDWIAIASNPFYSFNSILQKERKKLNESTHFLSAMQIKLDFSAFRMDTQLISIQLFIWTFHTQLSQTFNLSLWMAMPCARCRSPTMRLQHRFFSTISFSMHKLRWILHRVWTTVGNEFSGHFSQSIISDEIYIYNSRT